MKYFHLIWAALFRSKTRTLLTLLSVVAAFLLFGMLDSVRVAFNAGGQVTGANRMVTMSRLSITQMLPYSLDAQIRAVPNVKQAAFAAWFGGIYRDPKNFFANFSVSPNYLDLYPEFKLPDAQKKAWLADQRGAIVGESLAKRHGWRSATPSRCRPRSSRPRAATTGSSPCAASTWSRTRSRRARRTCCSSTGSTSTKPTTT